MTNARISELEHSASSMFSFMGRGPGERTVPHSTPMARSLDRRMGYEDVATFEF